MDRMNGATDLLGNFGNGVFGKENEVNGVPFDCSGKVRAGHGRAI